MRLDGVLVLPEDFGGAQTDSGTRSTCICGPSHPKATSPADVRPVRSGSIAASAAAASAPSTDLRFRRATTLR